MMPHILGGYNSNLYLRSWEALVPTDISDLGWLVPSQASDPGYSASLFLRSLVDRVLTDHSDPGWLQFQIMPQIRGC
jgi:hypothetical protein